MAKVGVGTAVVTKDDRLVLGVRGRTMIAGSGPISARGRSKVHYDITATGPDHDKRFTAEVFVGSDRLGEGTGRTKKEAEQKAAEHAWAALDRKTG